MGRGIEREGGKEGKAIKSNVFEALASAGNDKKNGAGGTREELHGSRNSIVDSQHTSLMFERKDTTELVICTICCDTI